MFNSSERQEINKQIKYTQEQQEYMLKLKLKLKKVSRSEV